MSGPEVLFIGFKAVYSIINIAIELDQCPGEIRRGLELVRTLYGDLQHLITLRNECLPLLASKPAVLARTDEVITNAHRGIEEVCAIVERLRPEIVTASSAGKTSFGKRMSWMFLDSKDFKSQEPLVSRQHASVLTELNFLRITLLTTGQSARAKVDADADAKAAVPRRNAFDNIGLLNDMLAGGRRSCEEKEKAPAPADVQHHTPGPKGKPPRADDDMASPRSSSSTVINSEGLALLLGHATPPASSPTRRPRPERSPPAQAPPPAVPDKPPSDQQRPQNPEPSIVLACHPPFGHQQAPADRESPPPPPPLTASLSQQIFGIPVAMLDPEERSASIGPSTHHWLLPGNYYPQPISAPPPPPLRGHEPPRHYTTWAAESITPWVPSLAYDAAPRQAAHAPAPRPSPSYHMSEPVRAASPAPPPVYCGQPPAYGEPPRWGRVDNGSSTSGGTENVWVDPASSRLSTIPPELIYTPPQVGLQRPNMPAAGCPYPATPPR